MSYDLWLGKSKPGREQISQQVSKTMTPKLASHETLKAGLYIKELEQIPLLHD